MKDCMADRCPCYCIECYVCNSNLNPSCGENIDRSKLTATNCTNLYYFFNENSFACQKIQISDDLGNRMVMRGCTLQSLDNDPCNLQNSISRITGGKGKLESCEVCQQDLCNT
ncbi:hypothetical protein C0J52_03033 [Blattella germanica]|nr:hypothetical protein C0J52_03033 [Blattella germanica]